MSGVEACEANKELGIVGGIWTISLLRIMDSSITLSGQIKLGIPTVNFIEMVSGAPYQVFSKETMGVRIAMPGLIVGLTGLRLYIRGRRGWGWDDALVSLGCFWIIVNMLTAIVVQLEVQSSEGSQHIHLPLFLTAFTTGMSVVWSARMSILQTIVRITPDLEERKRRQMLSVGYVVLALFEISQVFWRCAAKAGWDESTQTPVCVCEKQLPTFHLISSIVADGHLVILPLVTISSLKKSAPRIHARLSFAFLAALCTTSLSIAGPVVALINQRLDGVYITLFEMYASLLVCNLPVLAAAVHHLLGMKYGFSNKSLPPMEFAASPISQADSTEISALPPITSRGSLHGIHCTFSTPAAPSSSADPNELLNRVEGSLVERLRSFTTTFADEEGECEAEATKIREEMRGGLNAEKGLRDHV